MRGLGHGRQGALHQTHRLLGCYRHHADCQRGGTGPPEKPQPVGPVLSWGRELWVCPTGPLWGSVTPDVLGGEHVSVRWVLPLLGSLGKPSWPLAGAREHFGCQERFPTRRCPIRAHVFTGPCLSVPPLQSIVDFWAGAADTEVQNHRRSDQESKQPGIRAHGSCVHKKPGQSPEAGLRPRVWHGLVSRQVLRLS